MSEQLIPTPGPFGENDNFLLERELGSGGMGGVYMGRDKMLDRPVAVKVMLKEYGEDPAFLEKFRKEAQAVAKLIHPNIAQVYSYGICQGMPYIAMELVAGGSLYALMQNAPGATDIPRVLKICQQVAQALQCASDQGFVHGDVKPENILLDASGNAKLVDFGLAAMQTDTDEIWGTPYYISPEKVRKEHVDFRADMYSLGGTLYHALTGVAPFEGADSIEVIKKRFTGAPKKPSELRPEITPAIDTLVLRLLALDKQDRYPSFEALLEAFKEVLSTGLTRKEPAPEGLAKPAAAAAKRVGPAGRRMVRTRRMTAVRRPGAATAAAKDDGTPPAEGEGPVDEATAAKPDVAKGDDEDEEGEGGSLVVKVILFVVLGLVLIGGVVGGLVWYKIASANSEKEAVRVQIQGGFNKARDAIDDTVKKARAFADEFDAFAFRASEECQKTTDELKKILKPEFAPMLKPGPTKELLDAIASTNEAPAVVAAPAPAVTNAAPVSATNAAPAKAGAATSAAPQKAGAKAPAAKADPKKAAPAKKPEPAKKAEPAKEEEKPAEVPPVVATMVELWGRAYGCQACAIRIRQATRKLLKTAEDAAALTEVTRENMDKLAELSRTLVDQFEQIKMSKDVENVKKGISYIKDRGAKAVEQTVKRLRIEKLEADRKAKHDAAAAAEKARAEKESAERKAKIEAETKEIADKFEAIAALGNFRQLDWKGALRQLETVKETFTTPEGQLAADMQIRKVNCMKKTHDVFIKSINGHVFRGKLKGAKVTGVNEREIQLLRGKNKMKITWQKFYKSYPGNLNELVNHYIVNGRKNAKPALNLRDWAEAMTGAALTMQVVCSEVNGAVEKAAQLAQEAVKQFPDFRKVAVQIFPDVKFEAAEE